MGCWEEEVELTSMGGESGVSSTAARLPRANTVVLVLLLDNLLLKKRGQVKNNIKNKN